MTERGPASWQVPALRMVAVLTAASGALQVVAPGVVLDRVARHPDRLSLHLFRVVGFFMVATSGTLERALRAPDPDPGLLAWTAAQKLASSGLLGIGVVQRSFSPVALSVAAFDFGSGLLCMAFRRTITRT